MHIDEFSMKAHAHSSLEQPLEFNLDQTPLMNQFLIQFLGERGHKKKQYRGGIA